MSVDQFYTQAYVILIGNRYFYAFSKSGAVLTAHSLSGAELFASWDYQRSSVVEAKLLNKKKSFRMILIGELDL